jgi:N utilization substance protein A
MNKEFLLALDMLEKEKGIGKEILIEAMENALITAYKKDYNPYSEIVARVSRETGDASIYLKKAVVEEVANPDTEIDIKSAKKISKVSDIGDMVEVDVTPKSFGRIAAQNAKGIVVQKIREVERGLMVSEFTQKTGTIVSGTVERTEKGNVMVSIGRTEAILTPSEQVPTEKYQHGDKIRIYVVQIKIIGKAPQVIISRSHPNLVKCLFEQEVPEIANGVVEIKSISREAGSRTKIAVYSNDKNVDAVGSCVGANSIRVSTILKELKGEKVDIIKYSDDPVEFIKEALSPAKIISCEIEPDTRICSVKVSKDQLSLAIGKEGQNARLSAKLTGYKIDIKAE